MRAAGAPRPRSRKGPRERGPHIDPSVGPRPHGGQARGRGPAGPPPLIAGILQSMTATSAHTMANAVPERSTRAPPPPPNAGAGRPPKGDRGWRAERSRVGPRRRRPRGTGEGWGRGPSRGTRPGKKRPEDRGTGSEGRPARRQGRAGPNRGSTGPSPRSRRGTPDHLPRRRGTGPPGGPSRGPVGGPPVPDDGSVERAT